MSIRFKFRSSVNFDTVEIGNRVSISVGDLRAKILRGKVSQQQQQGFDLVFSDAASGLEFKGDNSQIPSGSSVIVKRVPGVTLPPAVLPVQVVKTVAMKESHHPNPANEPTGEFDDLGADLCPVPDSYFPDFNHESDENNLVGNKKDDIAGMRLECQKHRPSDPSQAIPRGYYNQSGIERLVDEQMKLNKLPTSNFQAVQNTNLPLELKCSLCNTFFKEAVMIPCCQHSFCEKCIRQVLIGNGFCPKCFSSKCNVQDLLPNLSLRQAIEHFLESQMLDAGLENAMQKYVPDGESGIQAKEVSCAPTVVQRELELPQSTCGTGNGSHRFYIDASYEQQYQRNVPYGNSGNRDIKPALASQKINQIGGVGGQSPRLYNMQRGPADFAQSADFQGENQPVFTQVNVHDEADSNTKRKGGFWAETAGGDRNFLGVGGQRKGVRNCYSCGSPDHLMRDCPMSHQNPMFQPGNGVLHGGMPGYAPQYWNGSSFPPFRPYANMYSNPAMMQFNASMVPVSPFAVPPYVPSMCGGGLPGPGGNMGVGNMGPPRPTDHRFGLQHCENKRKYSNENLEREQLSNSGDDSPERYWQNGPEKWHDCNLRKDKEASMSHSDDSLSRRLGRKSRHEKYTHDDARYVDKRHEKSSRPSYAGRDKRSNSGKEDLSRSSDRHGEGRHRHHHDVESTKYHERRGHYDSDSSLGRHSAQKDVKKRRVDSDFKGSYKKHQDFSESGFEPSSPPQRSGGYRERDGGHDSRHSRHSTKYSRDKQHADRWQSANGSDEDYRDEYHYRKRRAH